MSRRTVPWICSASAFETRMSMVLPPVMIDTAQYRSGEDARGSEATLLGPLDAVGIDRHLGVLPSDV